MMGLTGNRVIQKWEAERNMRIHIMNLNEAKGVQNTHPPPPAYARKKQQAKKRIEDLHIQEVSGELVLFKSALNVFICIRIMKK